MMDLAEALGIPDCEEAVAYENLKFGNGHNVRVHWFASTGSFHVSFEASLTLRDTERLLRAIGEFCEAPKPKERGDELDNQEAPG